MTTVQLLLQSPTKQAIGVQGTYALGHLLFVKHLQILVEDGWHAICPALCYWLTGLTKPLQGGAFENYRKKLGLQPRRDLQAADAIIEETIGRAMEHRSLCYLEVLGYGSLGIPS